MNDQALRDLALPVMSEADGQAALQHLLAHSLAGLSIAEHIRLAATEDGRAIRHLAMLGLRYCDSDRALAVACELPADDLFLWTRWEGVHHHALLRITGARSAKIRIGGRPMQAVLVPHDPASADQTRHCALPSLSPPNTGSHRAG
ncbi:MAG: hypothetical protein CL802_13610 [Citromicrobium sp.]|nr:hypothetical protein [Citromicrobium sp.]|tara:strand:+ start:509 stop:946 length:438 start_codon:yes stop_codon:yes gene_type:complete